MREKTNKIQNNNLNGNTLTGYYDFILVLFCISLFSIDYFSNFNSLEVIEPQFLYLAVLNLIGGVFIYYNLDGLTKGVISTLKKSLVFKLYAAFILLCGLSLFTSCNLSLSLISLSRLVLIFCLFLNLSVLLYGRLYLIDTIVLIVLVATFLQASLGLFTLLQESNASSLTVALSNLKGNTGNINIFSASLCIKIPFVLFGIISTSKWKKWFSVATLFVASIGIFLTASRTAFIGLLLIIIVFSVGYLYLTKKINLKILLPVYLTLTVAFGLGKLILINSENTSRKETAISRLMNVSEDASANARITLWKNALKISQDYPLMGIGLGNWKVELLGYEKYLFTSNTIAVHPHNDFLEVLVETGFLNSIVFIMLFISVVFVNLKRIINEHNDLQTKMTAGLVLLVFTEYVIDSMFNFPLYRPTMQLLFCFGISLTAVNTKNTEETKEIKHKRGIKMGSMVFIALGIGCFYFNYSGFKASQLEYKIIADQNLTANDILAQLPKYPNSGIYGVPFIEYVGMKYYFAKDYQNAFECFKKARKLNPYSESDYGMASIFKDLGQIDSAYYHIKKSFSARPKYEKYFNSIQEIAQIKNDTFNILKNHYEYNKHVKSPNNWVISSNALLGAKYSVPKIIHFMDEGLKEFPKDSILLEKKITLQALVYFNAKKFQLAIDKYTEVVKRNPTNMACIQNIGISYLNLGQYAKALKYIEKTKGASELDSGRTEELIEMCKKNIQIPENK